MSWRARGVDLTRMLAWTGTNEPNAALNVALAARGVEAMFGTLGGRESWDERFARSGRRAIRRVRRNRPGADRD